MQGNIETRVGIFVLIAIAIFVYMGFQIDAFRFDKDNYAPYCVYFHDISGLSRKAEVKIAGVKVGWVDKITLISDHEMQAQAVIMVRKEFNLYEDAHAIIRQEGLLGPKYLELATGDPLLPCIEPGGTLGKPSTSPVSVDELLQKFKVIAANVESVTDSLRETIGGAHGQDKLQMMFDNFADTSEKLSTVSSILERAFVRNEDRLDSLLEIGESVRRVADKLEGDLFPSFQDSIEKISNVIDRDFNRVADKLTSTADSLEEASIQARDSFSHITSVTQKIDEGRGLIGKLVNEDETYRDLKVTVQGLKNYFSKVNKIQIVFDGHSETMSRPAISYLFEDSKFFFDMRVHPNEDNFYLFELASSERGWRDEREIIKTYKDSFGRDIDPSTLKLTDDERLEDVYIKKETVLSRYTVKFGLQFGKIFKDLALRFGIFENTGGLGVDIDIPFKSDKFRWVTTLEIYDMTGWNRINLNFGNIQRRMFDRRPHVKWLNRMFFMRNLYFVFGADDFASKHNGTTFVGAGLRFGDDDIKYLLPSVGGFSS